MKPLAFLTKHEKLSAVQAELAEAGFQVEVDDSFDTDSLGTFTGEVPRRGTQLNVAIEKARLAARNSGRRYGLGSEGSFGPDPYLGMSSWAVEVLAWWDEETQHAVSAVVQGAKTNYAQQSADTRDGALAFAAHAGFPSHGVIVGRPVESIFRKDFRDEAELREMLTSALAAGPVWLETDMRAHRNPTRMKMIRRAAQALSTRLRSDCPVCTLPGFGPQALLPGAVCTQCHLPTTAARAQLLRCDACGFEREEPLRQQVPPGQCQQCNP